MNKKETNVWFDELKEGDFVIVRGGGSSAGQVAQVSSRTKKRVEVSGRQYHVDSWGHIREYGAKGMLTHWIEPATEGQLAHWRARTRVHLRLNRLLDGRLRLFEAIDKLEVPELDHLYELLEDVTNILTEK